MTEDSETKTPLAGITVYLVNTDFEPDMVDYENNTGAFVASAVTDASGTYTIGGIAPGNYGFAPVPPMYIDYRFCLDEPSDPYTFAVTDTTRSWQVNFTSADPSMNDEGTFKITLDFKNIPNCAANHEVTTTFHRCYYYVFVPGWKQIAKQIDWLGWEPQNPKPTRTFPYGRITIFSDVTATSNEFEFWIQFAPLQCTESRFLFHYDFTLSSCPPSSTLEVDFKAKTIKRIGD